MKKALLVLVFIGLILPMTCLATEAEEDPVKELERIIRDIQRFILTILLILAGVFVLIAGFFFVTAAGDPNMIAKGRQMLIFALVGVAVALLSELMVNLLEHFLPDPRPPESPPT